MSEAVFCVMVSHLGLSMLEARRCRFGLIFEMFNERFGREEK